ncbi:MAG: FeoA family protein [Bacillota bacterium]
MYLNNCRRGQIIKILSIADSIVRAQAIRFGISEGEVVRCEEVVPAGPVVLKKNNQEIAVGRGLASKIMVELVS